MLILWLKTLHLIAMVCWFAGLFYLPRLFVYHAMSEDKISIERFKIMEGKIILWHNDAFHDSYIYLWRCHVICGCMD
jgi:uncharacterized membrane protein